MFGALYFWASVDELNASGKFSPLTIQHNSKTASPHLQYWHVLYLSFPHNLSVCTVSVDAALAGIVQNIKVKIKIEMVLTILFFIFHPPFIESVTCYFIFYIIEF